MTSTKIATPLQVKSLVLIILREALPSANIVKRQPQRELSELERRRSVQSRSNYPGFFHIDCAFQTFLKSKLETNIIRDVNEIDGIKFILFEVKSRIENLIADTIKWIKKPLVKPAAIINKYVLTLGSSVPQKMKLKQLGLHTLKVMFTNADQMTPSKMVELKKLIAIEKPLIVAVTELNKKPHQNATRWIIISLVIRSIQ